LDWPERTALRRVEALLAMSSHMTKYGADYKNQDVLCKGRVVSQRLLEVLAHEPHDEELGKQSSRFSSLRNRTARVRASLPHVTTTSPRMVQMVSRMSPLRSSSSSPLNRGDRFALEQVENILSPNNNNENMLLRSGLTKRLVALLTDEDVAGKDGGDAMLGKKDMHIHLTLRVFPR
jgi:hypothetical protein